MTMEYHQFKHKETGIMVAIKAVDERAAWNCIKVAFKVSYHNRVDWTYLGTTVDDSGGK